MESYQTRPYLFCSYEALTSAFERDQDYNSRKFLFADEKLGADKLEAMESEPLAEYEPFISKDQQLVMAMDTDNFSVARLTKGDAAPPHYSDDVSEMAGSTREPKAKPYADKAV